MNERRSGYLVLALVMSVVAAGVFAALAWSIRQHNGVTEYDEQIAQTIANHRLANPEVQKAVDKITHAGAPETLVVVAFVASLALLRLRQVWLTVVWVLLIVGGDQLNKIIKNVFERPRPSVADITPKPGNWSFPSGHAMDSMIGYGMLAYVLLLAVARPWVRIGLVLLLILLIGFSRVYLNAHFPSDVLGGFSAGMVCLGLVISVIEGWRSRSGRPRGSTG
jgi:undecaprenyl-diphosphatase